MNGPSAHLSWEELSCRDGTPYPAAWRETRAVALAAEFEAIRALVSGPLIVLSGYRTPTHNSSVGGAGNSQHLEGRALDLRKPAAWSIDRLYEAVRRRAGVSTSAIGGIGIYETFVHVDIRPALTPGRIVIWRGERAWAEQRRVG